MSNKGFTLVELSIVLIIIGMLIAGVSGASAMIKSTQLNAISLERTNFTLAINNFKMTYGTVPGDYTGGYTLWGATYGCTNADINTTYTGCNGDGDGAIDGWAREGALAWQHLSWAGMINGRYTGCLSSTTPYEVVGTNVPASKWQGAGWGMLGYAGGVNTHASGEIYMMLGGNRTSDRLTRAIISPVDAFSYDTKFDDGLPNSGFVLSTDSYLTTSGGSWTNNCTSGTLPASTYLMSYTSNRCILQIAGSR